MVRWQREGNHGQEPLLWFLGAGTGKAGSAGQDWLVWITSGLWGTGAAPGCLVSGQLTRAGGQWPQVLAAQEVGGRGEL